YVLCRIARHRRASNPQDIYDENDEALCLPPVGYSLMTIGYNKPLYILPFDHRSSFAKGLFGRKGPLTEEQTETMVQSKAVIYDAFKLSLAKGLSKEHSGIFVDSQFGAAILRDAHANGYIASIPVEKSGQAEFQFEFGDNYEAEIEKFQPNFV